MIQMVRGSEAQDFLRCRARWKWGWVDGLKPKKLNDKLFVGNLIHKFLEVYHSPGGNFEEALIEMEEMVHQADSSGMEEHEFQDIWELVSEVCRNYAKQWDDRDIITLATELEFMVKLDDDTIYTGTIDWVYQDENGNIWFADHKTTASIDIYDKNSVMDRQISRYWWALDKIFEGVGRIRGKGNDTWISWETFSGSTEKPKVYGFMYNIILKDIPQPPKELKSGGLSKAKSQKTTYELYRETLRALYGEEYPCEYDDILEHLLNQEAENGNRFFRRIPVYRNEKEVDVAIWDFFHVTQEMKMVRGFISGEMMATFNPVYKNVTRDCNWDCSYYSLCMAQLSGEDEELLINMLYESEEE